MDNNKWFSKTTKISPESFVGKKTQTIQTGQWGSAFMPGANNTARGVNAVELQNEAKIDSKCGKQFRLNAKKRAMDKAERKKQHEENTSKNRDLMIDLMDRLAEQLARLRRNDKKSALNNIPVT